MKPKECCNSNCRKIFYVTEHIFHQKDICDKCVEEKESN